MNKFSLKNINLTDIQSFKDNEGAMTIIQSNLDLPFRIMRVFSISAISCTRGNHAHKNCHQFIVCLSGSLLISVDDGTSKKTFPPGFNISLKLWLSANATLDKKINRNVNLNLINFL